MTILFLSNQKAVRFQPSRIAFSEWLAQFATAGEFALGAPGNGARPARFLMFRPAGKPPPDGRRRRGRKAPGQATARDPPVAPSRRSMPRPRSTRALRGRWSDAIRASGV